MWLEPGVDHERTPAAPVLLLSESLDAVNVGRGIRPREREPQPVGERCSGEAGVIDDDDEREAAERMLGADGVAEPLHVGRPRAGVGRFPDRRVAWGVELRSGLDSWAFHGNDTWQADPGV